MINPNAQSELGFVIWTHTGLCVYVVFDKEEHQTRKRRWQQQSGEQIWQCSRICSLFVDRSCWYESCCNRKCNHHIIWWCVHHYLTRLLHHYLIIVSKMSLEYYGESYRVYTWWSLKILRRREGHNMITHVGEIFLIYIWLNMNCWIGWEQDF